MAFMQLSLVGQEKSDRMLYYVISLAESLKYMEHLGESRILKKKKKMKKKMCSSIKVYLDSQSLRLLWILFGLLDVCPASKMYWW